MKPAAASLRMRFAPMRLFKTACLPCFTLAQDLHLLQQARQAPEGPLQWAIQRLHTRLLPMLLAEDVDPNRANSKGRIALVLAAGEGLADVVRLLLDSGAAAIDQQDSRGYTALSAAAHGGHTALVLQLLQQGAATDLCTKRGSLTALVLAAGKGHAEAVTQLLRHAAAAGTPCFDGQQALQAAVAKGHTAVVDTLIKHAQIASLHHESSCTGLLMAAHYGNAAAAEQLLQGPAAAALQPALIVAALRAAAARGHAAVVAPLLRAAALQEPPPQVRALGHFQRASPRAVDLQCSQSLSALHMAAEQGHVAVVEQLLDAGATVSLWRRGARLVSNNAAVLAAAKGHTDVVCALLRCPQPYSGYPCKALEAAVSSGHAATALALLQLGATPIHIPAHLLPRTIDFLKQECQASGVDACGA